MQIYFEQDGERCPIGLSPGMTAEHGAAITLPEGTPYATDPDATEFPYVSIGRKNWQIKILQEQIACIESEPLPDRQEYPAVPENDDAAQLANIQAIRDAVPVLLPVNEPFQTQKDITNAVYNATAINTYNSAVAGAEADFISYGQKMTNHRSECAKIDQKYATVIAQAQADRAARIATLRKQIEDLT
jgi:hypothetical protein